MLSAVSRGSSAFSPSSSLLWKPITLTAIALLTLANLPTASAGTSLYKKCFKGCMDGCGNAAVVCLPICGVACTVTLPF